MKTKLFKKTLAVSLAAAMVVGCALTSFATPCSPTTKTPSESKATEEVKEAAAAAATPASAPSTVAEAPSTSTVAGVATSVPGVYLATSVNGTIVSTSADSIAASFNLAAGEKPYAKFSNFSAKNSPAAKAVMDTVAATQGAKIVSELNIELGKMAGGKYSLLPAGAPIVLTVGLNAKDVVAGANYAVIIVRSGSVEVVPAIVNGNAISFATTGGAAAYAVIRY